MKQQLFSFDLNSKVAIYVPSTINVNEECDNTQYVKNTIKQLSTWFGGATATPTIGGWVSAAGEVVVENVSIVYSFCTTEDLQKYAADIIALCESIKHDMRQEAVTLEINGQVKFV
jgi:hypothetical protein